MFHKSHMPLVKWFWAMWMVAQDKGGVSALRVARQLDLSYRAAWPMLHKLRKAMGQRFAGYTLTGMIEMGDAFFGDAASGKRGRGAADKTKLVVMVEDRGERAGFIAMKTLAAVDKESLSEAASSKMAPAQHIHTDGSSGYRGLNALGHNHHAEGVPPAQGPRETTWVHIAISNAKRFLLGIYHGVSHKYLQAHLDEFCGRFNRRAWAGTRCMRLLTAYLVAKPVTFAELKA